MKLYGAFSSFLIASTFYTLYGHANVYLPLCPLNAMRGVNDDKIDFVKIRSHWYKLKQTWRGDDFDGAVIRTLNDEENVKMLWCCNHSPACHASWHAATAVSMSHVTSSLPLWPYATVSQNLTNYKPISEKIEYKFLNWKHMVRHFRISLIVIWIWTDLKLPCRIKTTVAYLFSHTETDD